MKKFNLLLVLALFLFVVGCSNNNELNNKESEETDVKSNEISKEEVNSEESTENNDSLDFIEVVSNDSILYKEALDIKVTGYQTIEEFTYTDFMMQEKNIKADDGEIFVAVRYSVENNTKEPFYSTDTPLLDVDIQSDSGYIFDNVDNGVREGFESAYNLKQGDTNLNPLGKSEIYVLYHVNKKLFETEGLSSYYKTFVEVGPLDYKDVEYTVKFK